MPPKRATAATPSKKTHAAATPKPKAPPREARPSAGEALQQSPQRGSPVDFVVSEIVRALYDGRLVPGQKLLEAEFTQKFGVGRGSVREAIRRLEADGLVTAILNRGASIRIFGRDEVRDTLEVTEHLAGLAARLAAERLQASAELDPILACIKELEATFEQGNAYEGARLRFQFYVELVKLTHNKELARLIPRYDMSVVRTQFRSAFSRQNDRSDIDAYRRIVDLIRKRDAVGAERSMRQQVRRVETALEDMPDHYFAD